MRRLLPGFAAALAIATIASPAAAAPIAVEPDVGPGAPDSRRRFNLRRGRPTSKYMPAEEDRKHGFVPRRIREARQ